MIVYAPYRQKYAVDAESCDMGFFNVDSRWYVLKGLYDFEMILIILHIPYTISIRYDNPENP